ALLFALVFVHAASGEGLAGHDCPHHEPPRAHGHDVHDAGPADGADPASPCTCVGVCHGSAASPVPATGHERVQAPTTVRAHGPIVVPASPPLQPAAYLLPYPNGPPLHGLSGARTGIRPFRRRPG